jgi:hypothetical protein
MSVTAELHDGRRLEFPDGTAPEVVQATVKKVLSGAINKSTPDATAKQEKPSGWEATADPLSKSIVGAGEAGLSMLTSATSGLLARAGGAIGGIAGSVATGKYGTQEGAAGAGQASEEAAQRFTYQPKTEAGQEALQSIGKLFEASKLGGMGPAESVALTGLSEAAQSAKQAVRPAVGHAARVLNQEARDLKARVLPEKTEMVGVGSAMTEQETMRRQRAADLPVPIPLTKGQATRTFEQQQFERETAKNPKIGEPLRERYAQQNEKILQNFDAWVDQTGAEAGSLRATGQAVSQAIVDKSNKAKTEIRSAYKEAKDAGHMSEKVDSTPLQSYLDEHQPEAINAPLLTSTEAKMKMLAGPDGKIDLNGLEEVRKMVGRLSGKDATASVFGDEVKRVIDSMTEGKGGDLYKKARALRFKYGAEFERQGTVARLLAKKPGTTDRAVAYEDVFSHSILKGSLDDVRAVRKTLQTAGPQGEQAWKELQGATIKHLKEEITKNVAVDQKGNHVISPAKLNALVTELEKDGKLDFIFGKKGAQQIRDVNGIAQDVFTAPPGSVNTSNTASILIGLLDTAVSGVSGMPLPIGTAANFAVKAVKDRALKKKVGEALKEPAP